MTAGPTATAAVRPTVEIGGLGGLGLGPQVEAKLLRTVVDTHLHLPDMFELTFTDDDGSLLSQTALAVGVEVTVSVGTGMSAEKLVKGEVTSIEGDYEHQVRYTIVRGYEKAHRFQRARRTRTFVDMTDGDIAREIANGAGVEVGTISDPGTTHRHVAQVAQTDWEFLRSRAAEVGYEVGVSGGKFHFRPPPGVSAGGGGALGAIGEMAGLPGGNPAVAFGDDLLSFRPRVSAACLVKEAEVRVWDPVSAEVVVGKADVESKTAEIDVDAPELHGSFAGSGIGPLPVPPLPPGLPSLGDPPGIDAHLVVDRPLGWGSVTQSCVDAVAKGTAEHVGSTFAEAEGTALGNPAIVAGAHIEINNVAAPFAGKWFVTAARHTFADDADGYVVRFEVSGRHDRTLLGLTTDMSTRSRRVIDGLVPGICTNNVDPDGLHRIKVALPWLAPDFETDWARVAGPGLGAAWGALFVPEVNDEVLVGFEFGDVRRPYVIGGLINGRSELDLGGDVVAQGISGGQTVKRGVVSRLGHHLLFDDDGPTDGRIPATTSGVTIGTGDQKIVVSLDEVNGELSIVCEGTSAPATIAISQRGPSGSITIDQQGTDGTLQIKSAGNLTLEAAAPGSVSISGGAGVKVDGGTGTVEITGTSVKLN